MEKVVDPGILDPRKKWKSDFAEIFSGSGCKVKNAAKKKKKRKENFCEVLGRRQLHQNF